MKHSGGYPLKGRGVIVVAGGGIVGLTTAYCLASEGWRTAIRYVKRRNPSSLAACALFLPYFGTSDSPDAAKWFGLSWKHFEEISSDPSSGVKPIRMLEMFREGKPPPTLLESLTSVRSYRCPDLPGDFTHVWDFQTWMIDVPVYMPYLHGLCVNAGVVISEQMCNSATIDEPGVAAVVDCCGHWSASEFGVTAVRPVRGQTVILPKSDLDFALGGDEFVLAPRGDGTLFGSLWQEGDTLGSVRPSDTRSLLAELELWCQAPLLSQLNIHRSVNEVVRSFAGVRPCREDGMFVTREECLDNRGPVIHNTGHGGSGVSLAWGTACEVLALLSEAIEKPR